MKFRRYSPEDYPLLLEWAKKRGSNFAKEEFLPEIGYLTLHDGKWVAAGFMIKCEGKIAMLEHYIADPSADREIRSEALDLITQVLQDDAKSLGFKKLVALTKLGCVEKRALKHQYSEVGQYTLLVREI